MGTFKIKNHNKRQHKKPFLIDKQAKLNWQNPLLKHHGGTVLHKFTAQINEI